MLLSYFVTCCIQFCFWYLKMLLLTDYTLTTCNKRGSFGPTQRDCEHIYDSAKMKVIIRQIGVLKAGVQEWQAPEGGYYTLVVIKPSGRLKNRSLFVNSLE